MKVESKNLGGLRGKKAPPYPAGLFYFGFFTGHIPCTKGYGALRRSPPDRPVPANVPLQLGVGKQVYFCSDLYRQYKVNKNKIALA